MTPPGTAARLRDPSVRSPTRPPAPPRRVSGPGRAGQGAAEGTSSGHSPTAEAAALRLRGVLDAPFLDRLTRGRMWIGLVAAALIGIVFTQVSLLRLNAGIGRSVQNAQQLERENAQLRDSVSRLGSNDRIQDAAAGKGMILPKAGTFRYIMAGTHPDVDRALRTIKVPLNGAPTLAGLAGITGTAGTAVNPDPTPASAADTPVSTAPAQATTSPVSTPPAAAIVPPVAAAQPAPGQPPPTSPATSAGQATTVPATR